MAGLRRPSMAVRFAMAIVCCAHVVRGLVPTLDSVRESCPSDVRRCEADRECKAELLRSFREPEAAAAETPPQLLLNVIACFNRQAQADESVDVGLGDKSDLLSSCSQEREACAIVPGCLSALDTALEESEPPDDGSPQLMAAIGCITNAARRRMAKRAPSRPDADKFEDDSDGSGRTGVDLVAMATQDCPDELATCKSDSSCIVQLQAASRQAAPPSSGSASMLTVIECLKRKARERRRMANVPNDCVDEMAACKAVPGCSAELAGAMSAAEPPSSGSAELMATVHCLVEAGNAARAQAASKDDGTGFSRGKTRGSKSRPTFRPTNEMSADEKAKAESQMIARIAAEIQCDLCAAVVEDIWVRRSSTDWVRHMEPAKSGVDGGQWGAGGRTVAAACAVSKDRDSILAPTAAPAFTSGYSVHPCTKATVHSGRCAERQQYHLRATNSTTEPSSARGASSELMQDTILGSVYAQSAERQRDIDVGVFRKVCSEVLLKRDLDQVEMTEDLMTLRNRELDGDQGSSDWLPSNDFGMAVCKSKGICDKPKVADPPTTNRKSRISKGARRKKKDRMKMKTEL